MRNRILFCVAIFILAFIGCEEDECENCNEKLKINKVKDTLEYLVENDENVSAILFGEIDTHQNMLFATGGNISSDEYVYTASPGSKGLTSYMILKENIDIDQSIDNWFSLADGYPKADEITIRMLLNHTSGIPDFTLILPADTPINTQEIIDGAYKNNELSFNPGDYWCYSNTNYIIAGNILEKITGKSYHQLLNSYFGQIAPSLFIMGEREFEDAVVYLDLPFDESYPKFAGGLVGTSEDVLKAFSVIYNEPEYQEMLDFATAPSWGTQCSDCICDLYIYADKYGVGTAQYTFDKIGDITGADGDMGIGLPQLFTKNGKVYFINTIVTNFLSSQASLDLKKAHAQAVFDIIN